MANVPLPLSLSSSTFGSTAQATSWVNRSLGDGRPMALSKKTLGTTYRFDDDSSSTSIPKADKGMGRNE